MNIIIKKIIQTTLLIGIWLVAFPIGLIIIGYQNGWIIFFWLLASSYFSWKFANKITNPKINKPKIEFPETNELPPNSNQIIETEEQENHRQTALPTLNETVETTHQADEFVPDEDAFEWPKGRPVTYYKVKLSLTFSYIDNSKQESRRTVDFFEQLVFRPERKFLIGICRIRQDERIFAMRKMTDIFDADTGEVVEDIHNYVKEMWKNDPGIALGRWFDTNSNFLVLKGISHTLRMHGDPSEKEYDVVIKMASQLLKREDFDTEAIDMACRIVFPNRMLSGLMETIVKDVPDSWYLFSEIVTAIIDARGNSNPEDKMILDDLKKYENRLMANMAVERHNWLEGNGQNNSKQ